jgi:hypothetical protein
MTLCAVSGEEGQNIIPYPSTPSPKEHNGFLVVWLTMVGVVSGARVALNLWAIISAISSGVEMVPGLFLPIIISLLAHTFVIICLIGLWTWRKWAYYAFAVSVIITILIALPSAFDILGGVLIIAITYALLGPKKNLLV